MKQHFFQKLLVLALTAAFLTVPFTSCQNDDVSNAEPNGDISLKEYAATLNSWKSELNGAIDTRVKTLTDELTAEKENLTSDIDNENLQAAIVAKAVQIEAFNAFQTRATEDLNTLAAAPSDCSFANLQKLSNDDFFETNILTDLIWWGIGFNQLQNVPIVKRSNLISKFNALIDKIQLCDLARGQDISNLQTQITNLKSTTDTHILLIKTLLGISNGESQVLNDIKNRLSILENLNANKRNIETIYQDLQTVKQEIIDLKARVDQAEEDIDDLQEAVADLQDRVGYIEDVEIPAIWEGIEILYDYISGVYDNLDHRVTGLTFKPEYDFAPGLSSLILVKGIGEWETKNLQGGLGWQKKETGSVYKGITYLTYTISPSNVTLDDFEIVDLLYSTTTLITRSTTEPLLKIVRDNQQYPVTLENGELSVPVLIHNDAYPLVQTTFDANAEKNIKVALQFKNKGFNAPEEPVRPAPEENDVLRSGTNEEETRNVVSSEYVTVWLGLFDGRIAKNDGNGDFAKKENVEILYPSEIVTAEFLSKDSQYNVKYPTLTLNVNGEVNIADNVLPAYKDGFEKKFRKLADYKSLAPYELSFEIVQNLGNGAEQLVTLSGSKVTVKSDKKQEAIGKTLAVLVKANVNGKICAVGYVRVIIESNQEPITITTPLALADVTLDCADGWNVFTSKESVEKFISGTIFKNEAFKEEVGITDVTVFFAKYTSGDLQIDKVSVENSTLSSDELKSLLRFGNSPYSYYGEVRNNQKTTPLGKYTIQTTLKSTERLPEIKVTWTFTIKTPLLKTKMAQTANLVVNPTAPDKKDIDSPTGSAAIYEASLSNLFKKNSSGDFEYDYLNGQNCSGFVTPYFIFTNVPNGFVIANDGKSVSNDGVKVAEILSENGEFIIRLIENDNVYGLVGSNEIKVAGKGSINGAVYTVYAPFQVKFTKPVYLKFPENAAFNSNTNTFSLNVYNNENNVVNVIRDYANNELTIYDLLPSKLFINHYGINYDYETSLKFNGETLHSPLKFNLDDASFSQNVSNVTVTLESFRTTDFTTYYGQRTPVRYRLKIVNNGENDLPSGLTVTIPVTLKHRWGYAQENLVIKVK